MLGGEIRNDSFLLVDRDFLSTCEPLLSIIISSEEVLSRSHLK